MKYLFYFLLFISSPLLLTAATPALKKELKEVQAIVNSPILDQAFSPSDELFLVERESFPAKNKGEPNHYMLFGTTRTVGVEVSADQRSKQFYMVEKNPLMGEGIFFPSLPTGNQFKKLFNGVKPFEASENPSSEESYGPNLTDMRAIFNSPEIYTVPEGTTFIGIMPIQMDETSKNMILNSEDLIEVFPAYGHVREFLQDPTVEKVSCYMMVTENPYMITLACVVYVAGEEPTVHIYPLVSKNSLINR